MISLFPTIFPCLTTGDLSFFDVLVPDHQGPINDLEVIVPVLEGLMLQWLPHVILQQLGCYVAPGNETSYASKQIG